MRRDPRIAIAESPDVYRPSDDSVLLLDAIVMTTGDRFLEVGTGTGLIAIHAAATGRAVGTDVNPQAVRLARSNAARNRVDLPVVQCHLASGLRGRFDVVAFNPPYLPGRPADALDRAWHGGPTGSEVAVEFLDDLPRVLSPKGHAYILLTTRNKDARGHAEAHFVTEVVARKRIFFETLEVLRLRQRPEKLHDLLGRVAVPE